MQWLNPNYIWCFITLLVFIVIWGFWQLSLKKKLLSITSSERMKNVTQHLNTRNRRIKMFLILIALSLLSISAMGPRWGREVVKMEKKGRDIVFLVDVSRSMLAEDITPNRLEKIKLQLNDFTQHLINDRVGIVLFAGSAFVFCPLTLDYGASRTYIDAINTDLIHKQGTLLGNALLTAKDCFNKEENNHKAILLLTDGEDHGKDVMEAAKICKEGGIRILVVGIGNKKGSLIPMRDVQDNFTGYLKDKQGNPVLSRLNDLILTKIANLTKGKYYHSPHGELSLNQIYEDLQTIIQKSFGSKDVIQYTLRYQIFLIFGILFLAFEALISEKKYKG